MSDQHRIFCKANLICAVFTADSSMHVVQFRTNNEVKIRNSQILYVLHSWAIGKISQYSTVSSPKIRLD